ncbi:Glycine--tRNA ligase beta subunit [Frankliniella fusca]|uniref:Glycine--tRNA ligase beta subunit n=1 Tax=Frankliniella fusca TaxID=407009 RepID=A0AAE1H1T0_9NEOP|nr:Glycine--tRNA ligase beta subunit [Frankliniella fusca]
MLPTRIVQPEKRPLRPDETLPTSSICDTLKQTPTEYQRLHERVSVTRRLHVVGEGSMRTHIVAHDATDMTFVAARGLPPGAFPKHAPPTPAPIRSQPPQVLPRPPTPEDEDELDSFQMFMVLMTFVLDHVEDMVLEGRGAGKKNIRMSTGGKWSKRMAPELCRREIMDRVQEVAGLARDDVVHATNRVTESLRSGLGAGEALAMLTTSMDQMNQLALRLEETARWARIDMCCCGQCRYDQEEFDTPPDTPKEEDTPEEDGMCDLIDKLLETDSPLPPPDMEEWEDMLAMLEENNIDIESDVESEESRTGNTTECDADDEEDDD